MLKFGYLTLIVIVGLSSTPVFSQNEKNTQLYTQLDKEMSAGDALINNGRFHVDIDNTVDNEHRYFLENRIYTEEIKYDNQLYFNNKVKYDILKDELVLNPENQSGKLLIILEKNKVDYFTIGNRKFVKLALTQDKPAEYFEESLNTKNFIFYIKHKKNGKEVIRENSLYTSYSSQNNYFIKIKDKIHEVKSKKSILKLYPQFKDQINDYYKFSGNLESENNVKFMENLMLTIKKSFQN